MQGKVHAPVFLRPGPRPAGLLARPDVPRRSLHVGVLVTDPGDRPGRSLRVAHGLRVGLDQARDLDVTVRTVGATPFGPALLDAAAGLLDSGADVLVVTSTGVAGLVGPLCATRGVGLVVADEGDRVDVGRTVGTTPGASVLRRTEQHWQAAHALGQWAGRHLEGTLFQLVTHEEEGGDAVLALRAGFVEAGGTVAGSVEVWPDSASAAALVARVSGARVIAVHASGRQLDEIVGALRSARVPAEIVVAGRGVDERTLTRLARGGALYAASAWHRADVPSLVAALEGGSAGSGGTADIAAALGHDLALLLADACRLDALADLPPAPAERGLVVRRAAGGRSSVVARREPPAAVPDLATLEDVELAPVSQHPAGPSAG